MKGLLNLCRIYPAYIKISLINQFQYRAELVIWLISKVLDPVIYLAVWASVARASGGAVAGSTSGDLAAYFIAEMLVNYLTSTAIMWEYEYRVRNGALSYMLLRPLHPIHADLADIIANKLLTLPIMLSTAACLLLILRPPMQLSPWQLLAFLPALLLAFALRFLMEWTLAMLAFWTTRMTAIIQAYFVVMLFLSGQMTPLTLLPAPIQALAAVLPFRWMVAFPIAALQGTLSEGALLTGLEAQAMWLLIMPVILLWVWCTGVRKYSAVGA